MTRTFNTFEEYSRYYESHEHKCNSVDIVTQGIFETADAEMECKSWKTAIKRLARATGWEWVLYELDENEHLTEFLEGCCGVIIEWIGENLWYVAARQ